MTQTLSGKSVLLKCILEKVKRCVGILSKLLYYSNSKTLVDLYCALVVCPFLIYSFIAWDNTYHTTLQPLFILQKKAIRIISFSSFFEHSKSRSSFDA